jgi:hypothetical protein
VPQLGIVQGLLPFVVVMPCLADTLRPTGFTPQLVALAMNRSVLRPVDDASEGHFIRAVAHTGLP